jgi:hypothetical protein
MVTALAAGIMLLSPGGARSGDFELKAGTAKAVITPADFKGRITVMGNPARTVRHDIYARVLTLFDGERRLAIVTYDLNCLDVATPILRKRVRDELGLDPAYLILQATHNHAAPIQIVPANFDYGCWLADRIFNLIKEAMAKEQGPARVWFGAGPGIHLRSVGGHPVDNEVQLLKVTRGNDTVALLFNSPSHPLQSTFWRIEAGHPGFAVEEVERQTPGALALYTDAAGGNQFTWHGAIMIAPEFEVKLVGQSLGRAVMRIARGPMQDVTGPIASKLETISLPLAAPLSYEEAKALAARDKVPRDLGFVPYPHPDRETNWIRSLLDHYEQNIPFPTRTGDRVCTDDGFLVRALPAPRDFPCVYEETIVSRIGPLRLVWMQGEVCAPIGKAIKDHYRDQGPLMVSAYMGEHNLYIPTRNLVRQKAYQAQVIQIQYASPVGWSEEVEDEMVKGVEKIVDEMLPPR